MSFRLCKLGDCFATSVAGIAVLKSYISVFESLSLSCHSVFSNLCV